MCPKCAFASFRRKSWKEPPMFPGKHILKHVFPTCHVRVSKFYQAAYRPSPLPPPPPPSPPRPPTLNHELQISVVTAGPQLRPPDVSGHSQTPRAPDVSGHCHSPIEWGGPSQLVRAFADLPRSFREAFADFQVSHIYRNLWIMYSYVFVWIQIHISSYLHMEVLAAAHISMSHTQPADAPLALGVPSSPIPNVPPGQVTHVSHRESQHWSQRRTVSDGGISKDQISTAKLFQAASCVVCFFPSTALSRRFYCLL